MGGLDSKLCEASKDGLLDDVNRMLDSGANVHFSNDFPLRWASRNGHLHVVIRLIESGANVHAMHNYALRWASRNGHLPVVNCLLEAGANVHDWFGWALRLASETGHLPVVNRLLEAGANVHVLRNYAVRWALRNGHFQVVARLVEAGANINLEYMTLNELPHVTKSLSQNTRCVIYDEPICPGDEFAMCKSNKPHVVLWEGLVDYERMSPDKVHHCVYCSLPMQPFKYICVE